jgi:glycerol-3-phosphate dehydrogenase (NAD(P)+)
LGDLVLTCSSTSSRNFSLGLALGQGVSARDALAGKASVAEGVATAPVLRDIARAQGIDMPIVEAVSRLIEGSAPAAEVVADLLARPLRAESEGGA